MKYILILLLSLVGTFGYSQVTPYPTPYQKDASPETAKKNAGGFFVDSTFSEPMYVDTLQASKSKTSRYPGSRIGIIGSDKKYYRSADTARWILSNGGCNDTEWITGSVTYSGIGLVYHATPSTYYIGCRFFTALADTLTIADGHSTYPRTDIVVADTSGNFLILQGVPSANPIAPQVNPLSQIYVTKIEVKAGALIPTCVTATTIYDENIEWAFASDIGAANPDYATGSCNGTKSIKVDNPISGQYFSLQSGVVLPLVNYQYLKFDIKNYAKFNTASKLFSVTYYLGATQVSSTFNLYNGSYSYNSLDSINCQLMVLPNTDIVFAPGATFDKIVFTPTTLMTSFQVDHVYILDCSENPAPRFQWDRGGNNLLDGKPNSFGSKDYSDIVHLANGDTAFIVPKEGMNLVDDTSYQVVVRDPVSKKLYLYPIPKIFSGTPCLYFVDSAGRRLLKDTCSGSGTSVPYSYQFSATEPTDTTKAWIDSRYNIYDCFPVHFRVNGAWSATDTIGGVFWDNIGKVFTRGRPFVMLATGQSNGGGPYIREAANPNGWPFYGYYGDTIPSPAVSAWNDNREIFSIAKIGDTPFQYSSGANYLLYAAKKIHERTGKSVRIVTYPDGGRGLECWAGVQGTPTGDSSCYLEFKSRIQSAGIYKPDCMVWFQSESGLNDVGLTNISYYNKWLEMRDTMIRKDRLIDSNTLIILMHSGDTTYGYKQTLGNGSGAGEGALRALGASNNIYIKYVGSNAVGHSDGIHITPLGHETDGESLYQSIMDGQKRPGRDLMGYGGLSTWKNLTDKQSLSATGLFFTDGIGTQPYISLGVTGNKTQYTGAEANASLQFAEGLIFDPILFNHVRLKGYGNHGLTIEQTRSVFSLPISVGTEVEAYGGADPQFSLHDITLDKEWKLRMENGTSTFKWYYDGTRRFDFTKEGHLGLGLIVAEIPDSMLRVKEGALFERGVRMSGLPAGVGTKAVRADATGNFYLADTTVSGSSLVTVAGQVPFGKTGSTNSFSNSSNYTYDSTTNTLSVGTVNASSVTVSSGLVTLSEDGIGNGRLLLKNVSTWSAGLRATLLTDNRDYELPDASGTIALTTSNISGSAATITNPRIINGSSFNGSADISVDIKTKAYQALGSTIKAQNVDGDLATGVSGAAMNSQRIYYTAVYLPVAATITGVKWIQITAGDYTANNYNGVGLFTYSGGTLTKVASSTDDGNIWKATSGTMSSKAFASTYVATAGLYFVAHMYSSSAQTTAPSLGIIGTASTVNTVTDFTNSAKTSALITGQTALPATTQAMSGLTAAATEYKIYLY